VVVVAEAVVHQVAVDRHLAVAQAAAGIKC